MEIVKDRKFIYNNYIVIPLHVIHYLQECDIHVIPEKILGTYPITYEGKDGTGIKFAVNFHPNKDILTDHGDYYDIRIKNKPAEVMRVNHPHKEDRISLIKFDGKSYASPRSNAWTIKCKDENNVLYMCLEPGNGVNNWIQIAIGYDNFKNIEISIDYNTQKFGKRSGENYSIMIGQEHLTPEEYVEGLLKLIDKSKIRPQLRRDETYELIKMMIGDPRIEDKIYFLLRDMPEKDDSSYMINKKNQIIAEFNYKMQELNDEVLLQEEKVNASSNYAYGLVPESEMKSKTRRK